MFGFGKLKHSLSKTRAGIVEKIQQLVAMRKKIDADLLEQIEEILISGDVSVQVTLAIIERLKSAIQQQGYTETPEIMQVLKQTMQEFLAAPEASNPDWEQRFFKPSVRPQVILMVGVNGTGKTTTIGKLAYRLVQNGNKVLLAAADTFRAAACEQLEIWAKRAGVELIRNQPGADPAAIAFDSLNAAIARNVDVLIIDTAGRLHTKVNLMQEMSKIRRVLSKKMPDAPHEVFLVLDASTGQNGLIQAKEFTAAVGVTGLILTKLDGTAKGGVVFSIRHEVNLPVRFIGVGESLDDFATFEPGQFVEALFQ
ncbi:signal recognition particle-docking protein FtsY [candidate division KSB1 bacterium]|nr:signal recognition particle-docking protein FtsY [candidate division KSB1 bacterium]